MARWLTPLIAFLVPLAAWPGLAGPFSTPKLVLIGCWLLLATAWLLVGRGSRPGTGLAGSPLTAYLAWLAALALSSLTGELLSLRGMLTLLLPSLCFPLILLAGAERARLAAAFGLSSVLVSATAVLQYAGWDPFRLAGWMAPPGGSERLSVYGTLGNPNFVAAFLSGCLPLLVALMLGEERTNGFRPRWPWLLAVLLSLAAIVATGSRAPALGCLAALLVLLLTLGPRRGTPRARGSNLSLRVFRVFAWVAPLVLATGIIAISSARPLVTTLQGRAYIARMVVRNIQEIPLFGFGPGAFSVKYVGWETRYLQGNQSRGEDVFRGPQDHAHNDYLELLTDTGPVGLASFVALSLFLALPSLRGNCDRFTVAGLAGAAILLTIALVDFPLYRPSESFLLWSLLAIATRKRERPQNSCKSG